MLRNIIFVSNETKIYDFCFIYPFYWTSLIDTKIKFNNTIRLLIFFLLFWGLAFKKKALKPQFAVTQKLGVCILNRLLILQKHLNLL